MTEPTTTSPHDALFRHAFSKLHNAAGLLRALLPAVLAEAVDWDGLRLCEGSYLERKLGPLESDLLFSAPVGGSEMLFYVLVEHQSSIDPMMAWRLWRYLTRVWERWLRDQPEEVRQLHRLPRVIPIVVYHGARPWTAGRSIGELIDAEPALGAEVDALRPELRYLLDDLTELRAEELRGRALPAFGALALWALQNAGRGTFAQTVGLFRDLFDALLQSRDGVEALAAIFRYLSLVTGEEERDVVDTVLSQLSEPVREQAMTLYDHFIQTGKAEGRAEGRVEGRAEVLAKQLQLKFGPLSEEATARIRGASAEELDRWVERVLTAESLDAVWS